jgi:hypothetical protein
MQYLLRNHYWKGSPSRVNYDWCHLVAALLARVPRSLYCSAGAIRPQVHASSVPDPPPAGSQALYHILTRSSLFGGHFHFSPSVLSLIKTSTLRDLRFLWWFLWRVLSSGMWRRVIWEKLTYVSDDLTASIFRIKEKTTLASLGYSSTLKIEAVRPSETKVNFCETTRHNIPEDCPLHNHRCKNLKHHPTKSALLSSEFTCGIIFDN